MALFDTREREVLAVVSNDLICQVREDIMQMAGARGLDPTVVFAALADVIGIACARLEQITPSHRRVSVSSRLQAVEERARQTYARAMRGEY